MEYWGAWGTLIHEKKRRSKISCQTPFKAIPFLPFISLFSCYVAILHNCSDAVHTQAPAAHHCRKCPLLSLSWTTIFSGSQTACTQCTFSTLPGVIVPGTGSQPSYTASSEQAPIHFTAENSISGTPWHSKGQRIWKIANKYFQLHP